MYNSSPIFIKRRLYLQTSIMALFLFSMILVSVWTGNTLTMITAIARFERTHTVSRLQAKVALLEYLATRQDQAKESFYENMAITQAYNKVFSNLLNMRSSTSKEEFIQILESTFKEADHKTAEIIVNRIKVLYWHPIVKELVSYADRANHSGETIVALAALAMATDIADDKEKQQSVLLEIRDAEANFISYERSFSKRCSDLANEIATFVDYFFLVILVLSAGVTSLITYLLVNSLLQQAVKHARDLEESQERLNLVIKGSNDAPWDWDLISNELYYSPQWWAQLGYTMDEFPADAALWERLMHPEDGPTVNAVFKGALANKDSYEAEFRLLHKDGHYVPVLSRGFITRDQNGAPVRVSGTNLDLTDRKKTEEALVQSEQRRSLVLEAAKVGTWEWDLQTNENIWSNELWLLYGLEPYSCAPSHEEWREIVHPADRSETERILKEAVLNGIAYDTDWRVNLHDGTERWLMSRGRPLKDIHGGITRYLGIVMDITEHKLDEAEKKELQAQLIQTQKMEAIGQLAGGVAHDFNNMLGVIQGHAEMAMELLDPAQPLYTDLNEILKAARRSADITRQLLAFARKQTIAPKVLDLNETVEGMLKMLRRLIGEDIDLVWMPGSGLWQVKVDPSQIDQILANLCINARAAIAGVGKITVMTENCTLDEYYSTTHTDCIPGEYVRITVSDSGCGMDKITLAHIFEPFFTTKGVGEGTGLGLATVFGAVKQNNGIINVYSEPGQRTSFAIHLPRYLGNTQQRKIALEMEPAACGHETILLVEDEPAILGMTVRMLERLGYTVLAANSPDAAMRQVDEFAGEVHMLMTDVVMPGMNGRDLADRLLKDHPTMKCLFMSGYTANIITNQGVLSEGMKFIQKPFFRKELAAKVRQVLENKDS